MPLLDTLRAVAKRKALDELCLPELPSQSELNEMKAAFQTLLSNWGDVQALNHALISYIAEHFPSRMADVSRVTAKYVTDIPSVLDGEMDNLFLLQSAIEPEMSEGIELKKLAKNPLPDILKRSDLKAVYSVINEKVYDRHLKYLYENIGADDKYLYHCSATENWAGIITQGLKVRPRGIQIHGKSLGEGVYFMSDIENMATQFLSQTGSFTDDEFVNGRFFGIYEAALTEQNHKERGNEYCVFHEDAVYLKFLVELWAV